MWKIRVASLWVLVLVAALIISCGVFGAEPQYGGTLVIGLSTDIPIWDSQLGSGMPTMGIVRLVEEYLTDHHWQTGELIPWLCESWEASPGATEWVLHLREGVKFHDGTPFNAEATKYNIERMLQTGAGKGSFDMVESVEVTDEYTAVVHTTPFAGLMNLFTYHLGIVSPTQDQELGEKYHLYPVGTGAYQFVKHIRGDYSLLVANEEYWRGRPYIDKIIIKPIPETGARMAALESGAIHIAYSVPSIEVPRLEAVPGVEILRASPARTMYCSINNLWGPFQDKRVRQALNYAVNKQAIVDNIFLGQAEVSTAPFTPLCCCHVPQEPYEYDPQKAKALLVEAGYPDGFDVTLSYGSGRYMMDTEVVTVIASYLENIGLDVTIAAMEWAAFYAERTKEPDKNRLQLSFFGWGCTTLDPDHCLRPYRPDMWPPIGTDPMYYSNDRFVELFWASRRTTDPNERLAYTKEIIEMVWEDAPAIFLYVQPNTHAKRSEVHEAYIRGDETIWLRDAWLEQ